MWAVEVCIRRGPSLFAVVLSFSILPPPRTATIIPLPPGLSSPCVEGRGLPTAAGVRGEFGAEKRR